MVFETDGLVCRSKANNTNKLHTILISISFKFNQYKSHLSKLVIIGQFIYGGFELLFGKVNEGRENLQFVQTLKNSFSTVRYCAMQVNFLCTVRSKKNLNLTNFFI
jgi:hypothetical protein